MYSGTTLRLTALEGQAGLVELCIDHQSSSVNKIDRLTLKELEVVLQQLEQDTEVRGLLITSAKSAFVVGADLFGFPALFKGEEAVFQAWIRSSNALFNRLEALPFPTVAAVNGLALGGGCELALAADMRVLADTAKVGLPETTLGICPGWGGTVRLSRLTGVLPALEMVIGGKPVSAAQALESGLADHQAAPAELRQTALNTLVRLANGELDYRALRQRKQAPAVLDHACTMETLQARFARQLSPHYPAPQQTIEAVLAHAGLPFDAALEAEHQLFVRLGRTETARSLVGLFINEQQLKQAAKRYQAQGKPVQTGAVLGAGIMGGGIAYQSAVTGTPVVLKDIRQDALDLGLSTAEKALDKLIEKGRMDESGKRDCLGLIRSTLSLKGFDQVDLVVEAVVENEGIKAAVLKETEVVLKPGAILTSNTSTISITALAKHLRHPEQFCGMHFFNPVPLMPLVEVIRGEQSSDEAVATAVSYAVKMGKSPIVVNDCPGFLVNRVLFPYFNAFNRLLHDGVDFQRIDRVMEGFGWPMGPAYLADVVGLDTMVHADQVLQRGFPVRMGHSDKPIIEHLLEQGALGQKNGTGFYDYSNGPRNKQASPQALDLIARQVSRSIEISDHAIIDRMMIPMCLETFRCLDEGIVASAAEADMGLILGLGFPKFRGGALRYIDHLGLDEFVARTDRLAELGALYSVPESFRARCASASAFF